MTVTQIERKVALIAGISNNLGLNIAYRLIEATPSEARLTLVVTSRTLSKVKEAVAAIKGYNEELSTPKNIDFDYALVDFTNMVSVLAAYHELDKQYTHIDYLYVCSGLGVYDGINWVQAVKEIACNPIEGVTQPQYKIQRVGVKSKDGMGLVFQANVFGPYYLIHRIQHLLQGGGKVIWVSSLMSKPSYFSFNDVELLENISSYEGSKRLIDLLHLGTYRRMEKLGIRQYLVQPGIFESLSFHKYLNVFTFYGMLLLFYLARWFGSPWHNINGYAAAESSIYVTLNEDPDPSLKIGSATRRSGERYLIREEVDSTGAEDIVAYLDALCVQWDASLKDQIVNTRIV